LLQQQFEGFKGDVGARFSDVDARFSATDATIGGIRNDIREGNNKTAQLLTAILSRMDGGQAALPAPSTPSAPRLAITTAPHSATTMSGSSGGGGFSAAMQHSSSSSTALTHRAHRAPPALPALPALLALPALPAPPAPPAETNLLDYLYALGFPTNGGAMQRVIGVIFSGELSPFKMALIRAVVQSFNRCGGETAFGNISRDYVCAVLLMLVGCFQAMTNMDRCAGFREASDMLLTTHRLMMWNAFWYVCDDLCHNLRGWNISKGSVQFTNEQLNTEPERVNAFIKVIDFYNGN
jgi:hypothetical protein